uniref:lachrymatory-factor synthase n=1 Tax=Erigeron canadensis TaxID=72917 RepID=UPI001CB954AF|nr:lachrymatory-factor synthase [Erigeron canadensis]
MDEEIPKISKRWEGKATTQLETIKAEDIWPLIEDFCNIHKWLPTIDTCHHVQGDHGQPGLVRYCASTLDNDNNNNTAVKWCHEKLISIDHAHRCLSYEIMENNIGFTCYMAELKVIENIDDHGCKIEWSFVADPVQGWRFEDLCGYVDSSLKAMAGKMEEALQAATNN